MDNLFSYNTTQKLFMEWAEKNKSTMKATSLSEIARAFSKECGIPYSRSYYAARKLKNANAITRINGTQSKGDYICVTTKDGDIVELDPENDSAMVSINKTEKKVSNMEVNQSTDGRRVTITITLDVQ